MALAPGRIYANSQVRVTIHFVDLNGNDIDPVGVTFRSHDPLANELKFVYDGTNTPLTTVIKTSAGHYYFDLLVNLSGRWYYRWETSGTPANPSSTVAIAIASPAVVTMATGNLPVGVVAGTLVNFTTTGQLPTPIVSGINYFVLAAGLTPNSFEFSATLNGPAINTSGTQAGVQTANFTLQPQAATVSQMSAMEGDILVQRSRFTPFDWPFSGPGGPGTDWWYS